MAENRIGKKSLLIAFAQIGCIVGVVVYVFVTMGRPRPDLPPELVATFALPNNGAGEGLLGREGWVAEDFFGDPDALRAAGAIVAQDSDALRLLIDAGLDVNLAGKAGVTLLFWALVVDNRGAFDLLLDSGADPDKRLFGTIVPRRTALVFTRRDTVLFASLKISRADYFLAALEYTDNVNQRNLVNDTFLHTCTKGTALVSPRTARRVLQPLIDAGFDLDAQDRYGCTAAYYAAEGNSELCLQLLQAGADPEIPTDQGNTLADRLSYAMKRYKDQGLTQYLAEARRVKQWLDANRKAAAPE